MKNKVLRGVSALVLTAVVLTAAPNLGYAAGKTTKQMAKECYAEFLKDGMMQKYAVVDITGDKIPELLCVTWSSTNIYTYDKKRDSVKEVTFVDAADFRYDASKRVLVGRVYSKGGAEGEGGDDKWEHIKSEEWTQFYIVNLTKEGKVKSSSEASKYFTTYVSKYADETTCYPSKSKYEAAEKKFKSLKKKITLVKNTSSNRKKLK